MWGNWALNRDDDDDDNSDIYFFIETIFRKPPKVHCMAVNSSMGFQQTLQTVQSNSDSQIHTQNIQTVRNEGLDENWYSFRYLENLHYDS